MPEELKPKRTLIQRCGDALDVVVGPVHVIFEGRTWLIIGVFALGVMSNTAFAHAVYAKLWALIQTWLYGQ